jgi:hypothetical protein
MVEDMVGPVASTPAPPSAAASAGAPSEAGSALLASVAGGDGSQAPDGARPAVGDAAAAATKKTQVTLFDHFAALTCKFRNFEDVSALASA